MSTLRMVTAIAFALYSATASVRISAAPVADDAKAVVYEEVKWEALVPDDWEELKQFRKRYHNMVSDSDPKAWRMYEEMQHVWDNAPSNPKMEGAAIKLPGFVVPLDQSSKGIKDFLLVPYFGACIHSPPPPANQIVHVTSAHAVKGIRSMDTVWVSGRLHAARKDTAMGVTGYLLDAAVVEPYREPEIK